jgi:spore germination protein GerM
VRRSPRRGASWRLSSAGRRRRRPVLAWFVALVVLAGLAAVAARLVRPLGPHGRAPGPPTAAVQVFFVRTASGGRAETLAAAGRRVAAGPEPALLEAALRALLAGPSRGERARGLASEIPSGTVLRSVALSGGIATVDLGVAFAQGGGSATMLGRVWQVVYTATQFRGVAGVQLLIGGRRVAALGGEGVMIGAPLRRPAAMPSF